MLAGFQSRQIHVEGRPLHVATAGSGPAVLLLHGYPQTHAIWRHVGPVLARHFSVVAPDLRGYGASHKPLADADGTTYSKRAMAAEFVGLMEALGHEQFHVAGHDRGGRVAYRLALDHPDRVRRLAVLDIIPTVETWEGFTGRRGLVAWHWYFLAQAAGIPERLIASDPEWFLRTLVESWLGRPNAIEPAAMAAYVEAFRDPDTIRASCDDYRAGAGIDVDLDKADREAGRRIRCPVLALWGDRGGAMADDRYLQVWRRWADDVRGRPLPGGHFLPEEAPEETGSALLDFFSET